MLSSPSFPMVTAWRKTGRFRLGVLIEAFLIEQCSMLCRVAFAKSDQLRMSDVFYSQFSPTRYPETDTCQTQESGTGLEQGLGPELKNQNAN